MPAGARLRRLPQAAADGERAQVDAALLLRMLACRTWDPCRPR